MKAKDNEKKSEAVAIPLNNNKKTAKKREIILPSEANPQTDRIIAPAKANKKISDKYRILINKSKYTLSLLKGDELVKTYPVAVGRNKGDKERVGDNRTPTGKFRIVSMENASSWTHDFHDGKGKIAGAYGPYFLRLDAKGWKGIGIHGTHDPDSRGTNATEGCIRLSNEDIAELREKYAYRNMPVEIQE
ncbi:MAG: L,D-transpeptidase [Synergistaceae bacterium]|nr:L,D-transpeptidase [Synergistaceae bacterium]